MVQITIRNTHKGPSSDLAIAFAKLLMANKKLKDGDIKDTPEYKEYTKRVQERNELKNGSL